MRLNRHVILIVLTSGVLLLGACKDNLSVQQSPAAKQSYDGIWREYFGNSQSDSGSIHILFGDNGTYYYMVQMDGQSNTMLWSGHYKILNDFSMMLNDCPDYFYYPVRRSLGFKGKYLFIREGDSLYIRQDSSGYRFSIDLNKTVWDTSNIDGKFFTC